MRSTTFLVTLLLVSFMVASTFAEFGDPVCARARDRAVSDLNFRDAQCDLSGRRFECYKNNMELFDKELRQKGCAR